jgi:hypothetical protein
MELAIKSKEIFPSAEIRSLSDAEIDQADGGYAGVAIAIVVIWTVHQAIRHMAEAK